MSLAQRIFNVFRKPMSNLQSLGCSGVQTSVDMQLQTNPINLKRSSEGFSPKSEKTP